MGAGPNPGIIAAKDGFMLNDPVAVFGARGKAFGSPVWAPGKRKFGGANTGMFIKLGPMNDPIGLVVNVDVGAIGVGGKG